MHRARNARQKRLTWIVQANHFDACAYFPICLGKLAHRLWRSSNCRGKAVDDVKCRHKSYICAGGGPSVTATEERATGKRSR